MAFLIEPHKYAYVCFAPSVTPFIVVEDNVSYSLWSQDYIQRFENLSATWKYDTRIFSITNQIVMNNAYQDIIGMGEKAITLILNDLRKEPNHWFWALQHITGYDPVKLNQRGNIKKMTSAWLEWGAKHGYI